MVDLSTHLNKLLYVAEKVYPEADAVYISRIDGLVAVVFNDKNLSVSFDPESTTERGRAQLMDIVFALLEFGWDFSLKGNRESFGTNIYEHKIDPNGAQKIVHRAKGKSKAEAIINLASEVL